VWYFLLISGNAVLDIVFDSEKSEILIRQRRYFRVKTYSVLYDNLTYTLKTERRGLALQDDVLRIFSSKSAIAKIEEGDGWTLESIKQLALQLDSILNHDD
jgi:hypothetical protein